MSTEVVMPQMGESITEGTLTKWLKKPGDTVQRDEPLFEISTDKVDAEIPSPAAGTLEAIKIEEGATVTINTVVCTIAEAGSTSNGAGAHGSSPKAAPVCSARWCKGGDGGGPGSGFGNSRSGGFCFSERKSG